MGVKFGTEEGTVPNFTPHRCNVSPLWGEKPQNRPLSKLNTGRFALRAMLPVKMCCTRLAEKCRTQKIVISAPSHNFVGLFIFASKVCIDNRKKTC